MISDETKKAHRITWYVREPESEACPDGYRRMTAHFRRTAYMRGFGFDVRCSCGWDSKTGGAVKSYVEEEVRKHRSEAEFGARLAKDIETFGFAFANITGEGFGGDMGGATIQEITLEAREWGYEGTEEDAAIVIGFMMSRGEIIRRGSGRWSMRPVQCQRCDHDPCSCGKGVWR